jgi:hypothetical protein
VSWSGQPGSWTTSTTLVTGDTLKGTMRANTTVQANYVAE